MKRELPPGGPVPDSGREVHDEIEFYLEERAKEFEAQGFGPREARREAEKMFGDVERISSEVKGIRRGRAWDEGRMMMLGSLIRDVKVAVRGLIIRPGFTALVVGTLALGIGSVTAIFSVVNASMLRALPFEEADDLVFIQGAYDAPEGPAIRGASFPEFRDWAEMSRSFEVMVPAWNGSVTLTGTESARRVSAEQVGDGYFAMFRVAPVLGRTFSSAETSISGGHSVVVISDALWADRFARNQDVLTQTLSLNGQAFSIIGVLPPMFRGTSLDAEVWLPIGNPLTGIDAEEAESRGRRWLTVVARLGVGRTLEEAQVEMDGIAVRLQQQYPELHEDRIAVLEGMREAYLGSTRTLMLLVLAATGLILVIAAANVASLLLVRTAGRGGEVVLRKALGAGRGRLISQFLTESVVLAGLGAVGGLVLGLMGASAMALAMPPELLPAYVEVGADWKVFGVAAGLMVMVGLLAGLAPALMSAGGDLAAGLRERSGGGLAAGRGKLQKFLVVGQIALALMLLVSAGLMVRSFQEQLKIEPGFEHQELYAFRITLPPESYPRESLQPSMQALQDRLESMPGIVQVAFSGGAPLRGGGSAAYLFLDGGTAEDRIRFYLQRVSTDWFETLGTEVLRGRALNASDLANPEVTVISQALAGRFFSDQDPVGQTIRIGGPDGLALRIVGVAENVRFRDLTTDLMAGADDPDIYLPWNRFSTRTVDVVLRSAADPAGLERAVREVMAEFDPDVPVFLPQPLSQSLRGQTAQARFGMVLLSAFSVLASVLALVGLYGVLAFAVDQRKREIAIRMALGARAGEVRSMVVAQGMRLAAVGLIVGLAGAVFASRSLETFLYAVESSDPTTYGVTAGLMALVALLAAWVPAVKATRVDPQKALMGE